MRSEIVMCEDRLVAGGKEEEARTPSARTDHPRAARNHNTQHAASRDSVTWAIAQLSESATTRDRGPTARPRSAPGSFDVPYRPGQIRASVSEIEIRPRWLSCRFPFSYHEEEQIKKQCEREKKKALFETAGGTFPALCGRTIARPEWLAHDGKQKAGKELHYGEMYFRFFE